MKKKLTILAVVALVLTLALAASAQGPSSWTEYPGNPIFGEGVDVGPKAYYPSVLYDADSFPGHSPSAKYKMWYGTTGQQTGLATSDDGISWTDHGVVMTYGHHATVEYYPDGFSGANSDDNPSGSTMYYRMWYWDVGTLYDISAIGYTESPNGVNWYNYQPCQNMVGGIPIITGVDPEWNRGSYGPSDILYNPNASNTGTDWTFTMYYDGTTGGDEAIGLGFSSDGITWTGYDADSDGKADPVFNGTNVGGDWDENYVSRATIIKNADGSYEMWYSGGVGTMNHGIGYATSSDGINWTRDANKPIFYKDDSDYPGDPWRQSRTYCPMVIKDGSAYKMWFTGKDNDTGYYAIGYATTLDQITGEGYILSRNPDFSTDDREFATTDTLHIMAYSEFIDFNNVRKHEYKIEDANRQKTQGKLTNHFDGTYTASVSLSDFALGTAKANIKLEDGNREKFEVKNEPITIVEALDEEPPSVPANLSATAVSENQIDLTWTASTDNVGVAGYNIFRDGNQVGTSETASFSDTGLQPSTSYEYQVQAFDAAENVSNLSDSASAATLDEISGEGFILSKNADFSTDDRVFSRSDTLYMLMWCDEVDFNDIRKKEWELKDPDKNKVKQNFTNSFDNTYTAAFDLTDLPSDDTDWQWKGKIEDNNRIKYQPTVSITVNP